MRFEKPSRSFVEVCWVLQATGGLWREASGRSEACWKLIGGEWESYGKLMGGFWRLPEA